MEFVTFEIAKKLKEKGFNEVCYDYYEQLKHCLNHIKTPWTNKEGESHGVITAPTISQVLKWLREKKNLFVCIGVAHIYEYRYGYCITNLVNHDRNSSFDELKAYETYEEATIAAIEYTLENLIEDN